MPAKTLENISSYIDAGLFADAEKQAISLLTYLDSCGDTSDSFSIFYFNLSGNFIDIGHHSGTEETTRLGINILENLKDRFDNVIPLHSYYYYLANAYSNLVESKSQFDLTFQNIESLVLVKNYYWRAIKEAKKIGEVPPEYLVNQANCLKRQFRLSEALAFYDHAININIDIPQAYINKSECLMVLNTVTNSYSENMFWQVVEGFRLASTSKNMPDSYAKYYQNKVTYLLDSFVRQGISVSPDDLEATQKEFNDLTAYRQFCCKNNLTLSEHGLYCSCVASARDDLTIPLGTISVSGDFVPQMEMVLNRIKSEFSLARRNYFEYQDNRANDELLYEDCYTELYNDECLGIGIEKIRSSFRICFGILDKIALAVCELFELTSEKEKVYFHNFWALDKNGRREKFESIKNPALLALYSIATDLNVHKDGQWKDFKDWRNSLEHGFLAITESRNNDDPYSSYKFTSNVELVCVDDFEYFVKQMLQLTRSAIFSFVFAVRHEGLKDKGTANPISITQTLKSKDFSQGTAN